MSAVLDGLVACGFKEDIYYGSCILTHFSSIVGKVLEDLEIRSSVSRGH